MKFEFDSVLYRLFESVSTLVMRWSKVLVCDRIPSGAVGFDITTMLSWLEVWTP